jgi:PAS domain S-box-containing protein/diguanylate cyclase (GGDEF)-like protein
MPPASAQLGSFVRPILFFWKEGRPLRLGVGLVIVFTLGYGFVNILPTISREKSRLQDLSSTQLTGIRLSSALQGEMYESRQSSMRVLLAHDDPETREQAIRNLHEQDARVQELEARFEQLGVAATVNPASGQQSIEKSWQRYVEARDRLLSGTRVTGQEIGVLEADFLEAQQITDKAQAELAVTAETEIQSISRVLTEATNIFLVSTAIKLFVLALLIWVDWKRIRVQKQLEWATRELKSTQDRFRQAYESAVVGMGIFKLDGTVIALNAKAAEILGYERNELLGRNVSDFMAPEFVEEHRRNFYSLPRSADPSYQAERRVLRKDGTEAWVRNSVTLLTPEGQEPHIFSITQEITSQRQANDRLEYLANYDPVTNLPNRHLFEQELAAALSQLTGKLECMALLYVEIDSFDFLKATFGRKVSDDVLGELGVSLAAFCQDSEMVGRIDDHVFGVLFKTAAYSAETMARSNKLREIFHHASETGKHRLPLSASIGIAYSKGGADASRGPQASTADSPAETLLKFARAAMLEARARGGDSIVVADPSLQERAAQRHQIESALLRGLRLDEFRVVFQPQFQVSTGKLIRFEALCRWTSAELGPIPPDRFIPIAEQTGLIMEIGRRVLMDALHQAKQWTRSGRNIGVAVNISPLQFMRPDFTQVIAEVLAETQFPPALLELEITEGIFIRDLNLAVARIRELQRLGLSIALDDFGTGYSSLSYLQRMPIDAVKLDRSFVSDLTTEASTVSMMRSVLAMAEALNLRVVSEGVETQEQLDILRSLGCEEAQGYLLGRPESSEMALQRVMDSPMQAVGLLA